MTNFSRRLKRLKKARLIKNVKNTMKSFRDSIQCRVCLRKPDLDAGEKIDKWFMEKRSSTISLTCPSCLESDDDS